MLTYARRFGIANVKYHSHHHNAARQNIRQNRFLAIFG